MKEARPRRPYIVGFHLDEMSETSKSIETEGMLVVARGGGEQADGECVQIGTWFLFWG